MEYENFIDGYDLSSLSSIRNQLSVTTDFEEFEKMSEMEFLYEVLTVYVNKNNLIIKLELDETKKFQKDMVKINNVLVGFIKILLENNYKNPGNTFIVFCDYFNLSYERTYKLVHPKIQNAIEKYLRAKIGNTAYNKTKQKYQPNLSSNIFDLIKK